jgi:predicted protein tyrosine phosphatase
MEGIREMKYLCVCQEGHSRSVALVREFHSRGIEALACGWRSSPNGLKHLCEWADKIFVLETAFKNKIPDEHKHKVVTTIDVGADKWVNPMHPELAKLVKTLYNQYLETEKTPDCSTQSGVCNRPKCCRKKDSSCVKHDIPWEPKP